MDRDQIIHELRELLAELTAPTPPAVDPYAESARRVGWATGRIEHLLKQLDREDA